jgi:hypothetical protein
MDGFWKVAPPRHVHCGPQPVRQLTGAAAARFR